MPDPSIYYPMLYKQPLSEYNNREYQDHIRVVEHADAYFRSLLDNETTDVLELAKAATVVQLAQIGILNSKRLFVPTVSAEGEPRYEINSSALHLPPTDKWLLELQEKARLEIEFEKASEQNGLMYDKRLKEYAVLAEQIRLDPHVIRRALPPEQKGPNVWFNRSDEHLRKVLDFYSDELLDWSTSRHVDYDFLNTPAKTGLLDYHVERPLPISLLRLSAVLPWDEPPVKRADMQAMRDAMATEEAQNSIYDRQLLYGDEEETRDLDDLEDLTSIVEEIGANNLPQYKSAIEETQAELQDMAEEFENMPEKERSTLDPDFEVLTWFLPDAWVEFAVGIIPFINRWSDIKAIWFGKDMWKQKLTWTDRAMKILAIIVEAIVMKLVAGGLEILAKAARPIKKFLLPLLTGFAFFETFGESDAYGAKVPKVMQKRLGKVLMSLASEAERNEIRSYSRALGKRTITAVERQYIGKTIWSVTGRAALANVENGLKNVPKVLSKAWPTLVARHPLLKQLSPYALSRAAYKIHPEHIKGQLLEEIVRKLLRGIVKSRYAHHLFGVQHFIKEGFILEYVPGHLVKDVAGRQFTDGLLVLRYVGKKVLGERVQESAEALALRGLTATTKVVAVIECKAGAASSRGLVTSGYNTIEALAAKDPKWREALKMMAIQRREEDLIIAKAKIKANGVAKKVKSIKEYEREIFADWKGFGQIQKDHQRFTAGWIQVDGALEQIEYHKAVTQYWSFIPSGIETKAVNNMEKEIQAMGFTGYVRKVPVSAKELNAVAQDLSEYSSMLYRAQFARKPKTLPPKK